MEALDVTEPQNLPLRLTGDLADLLGGPLDGAEALAVLVVADRSVNQRLVELRERVETGPLVDPLQQGLVDDVSS